MDELTRRIKHIQTVLSHEELRTLCFDLGLDPAVFENDDSYEFAENLLTYLKENNQLDSLIRDPFLDESMTKEIPSEAIRLIQLHNMMMAYSDKEAVIQVCNDVPLKGWKDYEQLGDRDFFREVILLASRKGHLASLEDAFMQADSNLSSGSFMNTSKEQQGTGSEQKSELIMWMAIQASTNDLDHLAFLMGNTNYVFFGRSKDWSIKNFVEHYEKRGRLHQVLAAKKQITE